MSIDGLRLALIRESLKYADMVSLCKVLEIKGGVLFGEGSEEGEHDEVAASRNAPRNDTETSSAQAGQLIRLLKEQIRDKERIIELMRKF